MATKKNKTVERVFLSCDYEVKGKKLVSAQFKVESKEDKINKTFQSKDVIKNWDDTMKFLQEIKPTTVLEMSSMNHFCMDQKDYQFNKQGLLEKVK